MFRIIQILQKHKNLLLFIVLEVIAFMLIVSFNNHQRHRWGDSMLEWSGAIQQSRNSMSRYFQLPEISDRLQEKNRKLQLELFDTHRKNMALELLAFPNPGCPLQPDSLISFERYDFLPCHAIRNSTHLSYNYITLDRGRVHGIKVGMGLVSPSGVAGKVIRVSQHFSTALSVINAGFKLATRTERGYSGGLFEWDGSNPRYGQLNNVPLNVPLEVGEAIVCSGYNTVFPSGVLIGHVKKIESNTKTSFHKVEIELATDFNALRNLFIIKSLHKAEVDSLQIDPIQ